MPSISDTYVTVLPETSKLAEGIRRAFRDVDSDAREAGKRWGREIEQGIGKPKVELEADTASAEAQMDAAARNRRSTVNVDVDSSQMGTVQRGVSSAIQQGGESGIAGMQPALMGVGVTMLAGIASALSGLGGLIPGALLGAGGLVGTLVVGLDGVKDAYDAVSKAADQSGQDQADKAREVSSAQRTLTDAVQSQAQAQRDVSNAYRDARQQLDDLNLSLNGGKISEAQAYNNVLKARRDLAKGGFKDQLELNDAQLRVASAEQSWQESKQRNVELQEKANDANAKGVENSDAVTAANERLRRTNEGVAAAQNSMNEAQAKNSTAMQAAVDSMAKLSPQAQTFVNTLMGMKPAFLDFKNSVQDALFAGIGPQFQQLVTTYMPVVQGLLTNMATTMNQAFGHLASFLEQPQVMGMVQKIFGNLSESFKVFMTAMEPATEAFLKFAEVGSGFLPQLAQMMVDGANAVNRFAQSGQLQQWIQTGMDALGELGKMLPTIMQMFGDLAPIGMATLQALNSVLTALAPAIAPLSTMLAAMITNGLTPMLTILAQVATTIVQGLAPAFTTWVNAMGPIMQQLAAALIPVLQQLAPVISQVATAFVNQLIPIIQQMIPYIGPLVKAFADLAVAVLPLIPRFFELATHLSPLFQVVLPGLAQAFILIAPHLANFLTMMANFATNTMPVVMEVANKVGPVFKEAFDMVKSAITTVWDVIRPIFELMKNAISDVTTPLGKLFDLASKIPGVKNMLGLTDSAPGGAYIPKTASSAPVSVGSGHLADWDKVAGAEAGGNWGTNTGNGFHGGLQFTPQSWQAAGGLAYAPSAELATPEQQKIVADKLLQMQGPGAWPATSAANPGWFQPPTVAPTAAAPATAAPASVVASPGDAALLANVPKGTYSNGPGDLTKGLADCSSAVEDLVNLMDGRPTEGRAMATGNEAQWLTEHGFLPGVGAPGDFRVGFNDHHTQATLPGGTPFNWGSNEAAARGGVGGTGADDPSFTQHYYRPTSGSTALPNPMLPSGVSPPVGSEQDPLFVSLPPSAQGQGDSGAGQLGQDFVGGILQEFGMDGSVFKNPMEFGLMKLFKGVMGLKVAGGDGASSANPMGAGGGGGLLGNLLGGIIPQPFGALTSGSPKDAPGEFMPMMPDAGGGSVNIPALAASGQTGAPGPGNTIDNSININGVDNPGPALNAATQANVPRMRQGVRNLPQ